MGGKDVGEALMQQSRCESVVWERKRETDVFGAAASGNDDEQRRVARVCVCRQSSIKARYA